MHHNSANTYLCSHKAMHSDFYELTMRHWPYTSMPLFPRIPKPFTEWKELKKKIFEKVPKGGTVIVLTILALRRKYISCSIPMYLLGRKFQIPSVCCFQAHPCLRRAK